MREPATRRTIQTVVDQARRATGATTAWFLLARPDGLVVAAGSGPVVAGPGTPLELAGPRAYALSSGQAVALVPQPGDEASSGLGGSAGVPVSVLLVPVPAAPDTPGGAIGLLEAAGKEGSRPFTLDDISRVGLLAPVVAAALAGEAEGSSGPAPGDAGQMPWPPAPQPAPQTSSSLVAALDQMAQRDPAGYAALAVVIRAVADRP